MDRDEGSIGGIEKPLQPTKQLFYLSVVMDITALLASIFISAWFSLCLLGYILASRAYSYRGVRLKKHAITGYITVVLFQGAVTFFMTYHGSSSDKTLQVPFNAMLASSLLIGGFYPLTQIYQHEADLKDGVKTLSYMLGYKGTFIFTAVIYVMAMMIMAQYFYQVGEPVKFFILATMLLPVLVYFFWWAYKVWTDTRQANFKNTMRMNLIAASCTNLAFITLLIIQLFE